MRLRWLPPLLRLRVMLLAQPIPRPLLLLAVRTQLLLLAQGTLQRRLHQVLQRQAPPIALLLLHPALSLLQQAQQHRGRCSPATRFAWTLTPAACWARASARRAAPQLSLAASSRC